MASPFRQSRILFFTAVCSSLASLPQLAAAAPSHQEITERNQKYLRSGVTERQIENLKNAKVSIQNQEDEEIDSVNTQMLAEFTTLFVDVKALSSQMADPAFNNISDLKAPTDLDWRIAALNRAIEVNSTALSEKYWENKYRAALAGKKISAKRQKEALASFMQGVHEGLDNRIKQLGLSSQAEIEKYRAEEQQSLGATKDIFELLKAEWGKWTFKEEKLQFADAAAQEKYSSLAKLVWKERSAANRTGSPMPDGPAEHAAR